MANRQDFLKRIRLINAQKRLGIKNPTSTNPVVLSGQQTLRKGDVQAVRNAPRVGTRLTGLSANDNRRGKFFNLPSIDRQTLVNIRTPSDVRPSDVAFNEANRRGAFGLGQNPAGNFNPSSRNLSFGTNATDAATQANNAATGAAVGGTLGRTTGVNQSFIDFRPGTAGTSGATETDTLTSADIALKQAQEEADRKKAQVESDLQQQLRQIEEDTRAAFAPQFRAATEAGARARETAQRGAAFAGSARGTRAEEQQQIINDKQAQVERAIAAEQRLAIQAAQAAARGASSKELESINNQLSNIRQEKNKIILQQKAIQEGLDKASAEQASDIQLKAMSELSDLAQKGLTADLNDDGTIDFSSVRQIEGVAQGTPADIRYFTDNAGNVTAVYPKPDGTFQSVSIGNVGGAKKSRGDGSKTDTELLSIINQLRQQGLSEQQIADRLPQLVTTSNMARAVQLQFSTAQGTENPLSSILSTISPTIGGLIGNLLPKGSPELVLPTPKGDTVVINTGTPSGILKQKADQFAK